MHDKIIIQFIKYLFVGGLAFTVDFSTLFILTEFVNVYYLISAAIAFICGIIVNYTLSVKVVFPNRKISSKKKEFTIFFIIGIVGLILNQLILYVGTETFNLHYLLSKAIATAAVLIWSFTSRKIMLF